MSLFGGLDLSVFATTETTNTLETELIDIDIYKAQCLAGIAEDANSNAVELCNSMYNYYINDNIHSPTQTFLEECYNDEALMADYTEWMAYSLAASPSSALDYVMKKEDYYESLIIAMYSQALTEDSEWEKIINNKIVNDTTNILNELCDVLQLEQASQLDEILDLSDPKTFEYVTDTVEKYYPIGTAGKVIGVVGTALEYGKNITDVCQRISTYNAMVELDNSAKLWLNQMYACCDENTDPSLKAALLDLKSASTGFAEAALVDIKEVSFSLANWGIKAVMDYGVAQLASLNPITASLVVGLQAGKTICNVFFATDDVCEQLFLMECIYDVQYLSRTVADECKATFVNAQTKDNALSFSFSVDCYYESIINVDIDCMIEFLDKLYNGGILKGFLKWIYGATDDYDECVAALESLRTTRSHNYSAMNDYFKQALYINYPETYEYYFVMEQIVPITGIGFLKYTILPPGYPTDYANIIVGSFSYVDVYFEPSNTTQKAYTITSNNPDVLEIKDGVMTAISEGTANVTVTSLDNPAVSYTSEIKVGAKLVDVDIDTTTTRFKYKIENNEITITGLVSGYEPETLQIPEAISEYPVTKIADFAFLKNKSIKSITLPSTITEIGNYAFYKCSALTQINFSEGLAAIGDGTFGSCSALIGAVLPSTVTDLGLSAFENCTSLINVQLSNNITELKDRTFYNCDSLEEITISKYVTKFGQGIFGGCDSLKKVYFGINKSPTTNKQIYHTSSTLQNIKSITISDDVQIIDNMCFYGTDLYSITIPDSIKTIGGYVGDYSDLNHIFYEGTESSWSSLMSKASQYGSTQTLSKIKNAGHIHFEVSLQNNTSIKDEIVPTCTADGSNNIYCNICNELLGSEVIPATGHVGKLIQKVLPTCTEQGYSKYYCIVCDEEYITDYVNATHQHNYDENGSCYVCDHNIYFDYSISNEEVTITGYLTDKSTITIPSHIEFLPVKHIANNAFEGCTVIENIKISNSITSISENAFSDCTSIANIDIPDSVISIGEYAFSNCSNMETITIGSAVTSIGNYSFADCINVVQINYNATDASENINADSYNLFENAGTSGEGIKVIIGNNVKAIPENLFWSYIGYAGDTRYVPPKIISATVGRNVELIGDGAFARCSDLANITFSGNKLTTIEDEAFSGCNFSSISFPNGLKNIGWRSFASCPLETLIIPDSVTSIGIGAFDCVTIKTVDTGDGVLNLDGFDFKKYQNVESVVIGNSVTDVPDSLFAGCLNLKSLVLGDGLIRIGKNAFQGCTGLTELIIPNNVTIIDSYAFEGCTNLTAITLGNNVTSIGQSAFENCTILETVNLGAGVKEIGDNAFNNCTAISTLMLPDSITTVGEKAFYNCCISGTLTIPENVSYIGEDAFYGNSVTTVIYNAQKCYMSFYDEYLDPDSSSFDNHVAVWNDFSLFPNCTEIIFGDNVTFIPTSLIANNANITSVNLPDNLQRIQPLAFRNCSSLTEITLPESITSVGFCAFENTPWLNNQPNGILYIGGVAYDYIGYSWSVEEIVIKPGTTRIESSAFADCYNLNSIIIPEGVTSIGDSAFSGCERLTTITLPDTVSDIGNSAFNGCDNLIAINIGDNNEKYLSDDGVLYNKEKTELIDYPDGKPGEYIIPNTINTISDYEFSNCVNMTSIIVPDSIKSIGEYAFYFCDSLTSITIGSGVEVIDEDAFDYCDNLCTIIVDDNNANFSSVDGVLYNKEITEIVHFPKGKSGEFVIPNTVTSIDDEFWSCEKLTAITIPDSVVEISDSPFVWCYGLTAINVDVNNESFASIDGVLFDKNITTIISCPCAKNGDYIIPTSVNVINSDAFMSCDNLTSLVIPEGVTNIPNNAFLGCTNLKSMSIPKSVKSVGVWPFGHSDKLKDIYFAGTPDDWANITFDGDSGLPDDVYIHYNTSLPHYDLGTITKEATCTTDGEITYICPCGYIKTEIIPALGHSGTVVEIIAPSCTERGYTRFNCSVCGEEYTDDYVDALGHDEEVVKTVNPACTEKGYTEYRCITCGESYVDNYISEFGHSFENNICVNCHKAKEDCIESSHNYENNCDETWIISKPNADYITITFSSATETERGWDYIYIYDMDDNLIGQYSGTELASQTITVTGNMVKIRLTSDSSVNKYGFAVSDICSYIKFSVKDVEVAMPENTIDSTAELRVDEIDINNIVVVLPEEFDVATANVYDIYFEKDEQRVQPNGAVTVYIPVPSDMDGEKCKVFHIDESGNATDMNAVYENGYMVFTTEHFSYYALVEEQVGFVYGDANGDAVIDGRDVVRLKNYLANYDYDTETSTVEIFDGADANGDGIIDGRDVIRLKNYLANYDYDTDSSTVTLGPQN